MGRQRIENAAKNMNDLTSRRLRMLLVIVVLAMLAMSVRLVYVQIFDASLAQAAYKQRLTTVDLPAERGKILDNSGNVLAKSVQSFDIVADQTQVKEYRQLTSDKKTVVFTVDQMVKELAQLLKLPDADVRKAVVGEQKYSVIARSVSPDVRDAVMAKRFPGVDSQETSQRVYPYGPVAGGIIGFTGSEGKGLEGIELTQNDYLQGTAGKRVFEQGANGIRIPNVAVDEVPAVNGGSIKLTINQDIQWFAQQEIMKQVKERQAQWGNIVVAEVKTGKIVAMAESANPDPNKPEQIVPQDMQPRSVTTAFEPGSTEKMITAAAAIEECGVTPLTPVMVPPEYTVDGQKFVDSFTHDWQRRTFAGIIGDSMNTGVVQVGQCLSPEQTYNYFKKFGIGEPTDTGISGETVGILPPWQSWDGRQRYTVLFGQGVSQTALQTAFSYQAIANRGIRLKPQLVEAYIDPDGTEHKVAQGEQIRVVSEGTAMQVRDILESVVTEGGAKQAQLDGYRAGGKTGTAEAPAENGAGFDGYTASFVGMAPMDDPQFVVGVTLQRPNGDIYGITTAPSFRAVMTQVLNTYQVPLSTGKPAHLPQRY